MVDLSKYHPRWSSPSMVFWDYHGPISSQNHHRFLGFPTWQRLQRWSAMKAKMRQPLRLVHAGGGKQRRDQKGQAPGKKCWEIPVGPGENRWKLVKTVEVEGLASEFQWFSSVILNLCRFGKDILVTIERIPTRRASHWLSKISLSNSIPCKCHRFAPAPSPVISNASMVSQQPCQVLCILQPFSDQNKSRAAILNSSRFCLKSYDWDLWRRVPRRRCPCFIMFHPKVGLGQFQEGLD